MSNIIAGAKVTELFGVDISGVDPATSVALTEAVLAQNAKTQPIETGRRVIITWPKPSGAILPNWGCKVEDADDGEQILTGFKLSIVTGTDAGFEAAAIEVDITALVDDTGEILGAGKQPVETEDKSGLKTSVFRFHVAEMRIAD